MQFEIPSIETILEMQKEAIQDAKNHEEEIQGVSVDRTHQGWVVFIMSHENMTPDQITGELGIEPDKYYYSDPLEMQKGQWQLNSSLSGIATIEDHFWNILNRLVPVYPQILRYSQDLKLQFFCTIQKKSNEIEPVILPPRLLLLIGYIGAEIEIEVIE